MNSDDAVMRDVSVQRMIAMTLMSRVRYGTESEPTQSHLQDQPGPITNIKFEPLRKYLARKTATLATSCGLPHSSPQGVMADIAEL